MFLCKRMIIVATKIKLENPQTGESITGFMVFWTTFLFGAFPALFRKDFITFIGVFVVMLILAFLTAGIGPWIASFIWAFMYNKYFTVNKIKQGFIFAGSHTENELAASKLGLSLNQNNCKTITE